MVLACSRKEVQLKAYTLSETPADAPYSALKAEILRLNAVSDRQRYHQLIKEESLGDRKPSELLRRMRTLLGDMQVDEKLVKEMFLEQLPADVQTISASGSQDLTLSHLAEMTDRLVEVQQFQPPSVAQIFTSSSTVNEQLLQQMSAMANEIASLKLQLARITCSRSPSRHRSRSRPRTANLSWHHANFVAKDRKCSSPCSFKPKQGNQPAREQTRPFSLALPALVAPFMSAGVSWWTPEPRSAWFSPLQLTAAVPALVYISSLQTVPPFPLLVVVR
nr:unnamed protein product [Spirometra erinaceieuropaei]